MLFCFVCLAADCTAMIEFELSSWSRERVDENVRRHCNREREKEIDYHLFIYQITWRCFHLLDFVEQRTPFFVQIKHTLKRRRYGELLRKLQFRMKKKKSKISYKNEKLFIWCKELANKCSILLFTHSLVL
jgi:hypothetical protein